MNVQAADGNEAASPDILGSDGTSVGAPGPALSIVSPDNGTVLGSGTVDVIWDASGIGSEIEHFNVSAYSGTAWENHSELAPTTTHYVYPVLADGNYYVEVSAKDVNGHYNRTSVNFTVDTTMPMVEFDPSPVYSSDSSVTVAFTASDAVKMDTANWTLYHDGTMIDRANISAAVSGKTAAQYSHEFALEEGAYVIRVTVNDTVGNTGTYSCTIIVDATLPTIEIINPEDRSFVKGSTLIATWTASDPAGIDHYQVQLDDEDIETTTMRSKLYSDLADGTHTLTVVVFDNAGNSNQTTSTFTVDNTGPVVTITSPKQGSYLNASPISLRWSCTATDIANYKVRIAGEAEWVTLTTRSISLDLDDGTYTVWVRAYDRAGNFGETSVTFTIDTVGPSIDIESPSNNTYTNITSVTVDWAIGDSDLKALQIRIDGGVWQSLVLGNTSMIFGGLDDGRHVVDVRVTDLANNTAVASVAIFVDTVAPTAEVSPTGSAVLADTPVVVKFSETMNKSTVKVIINGAEGTISWDGNNATLAPGGLVYGTQYTVNVTGLDLAGNHYCYEWTFSTAEVGIITGRIVDNSGNAVTDATITLDNGMTATTDATGGFVLVNVTVGAHELTVAKSGFATMSSTVTVQANHTSDLGELRMAASGEGFSLDSTMLIVIAVIIIAAIVAAAFMFMRKKKAA